MLRRLLHCGKLVVMKSRLLTTLAIVLGLTIHSVADAAKKVNQPTMYCSNMKLIDDAKSWDDGTNPLSYKADRIVVSKSRKMLYLLNEGRIIRQYKVSFGFGYEKGAKERRGDGRTPEGLYKIDFKKTHTSYHMALQVSYPNKADIAFAEKGGFNPGSDILIHGFPSRPIDGLIPDVIRQMHAYRNWTQGCIAVTNDEIEEIYELVDAQVPLEICSLEN